MPDFARIAVNVPGVSDLFDYRIPSDIQKNILTGCLVEVPFGQQQVQGIVVELISEPEVAKTREITTLLEDQPVLTPDLLKLAFTLSDEFLSPLPAFISAMLPPGLSQKADSLYQLNLPDNFQAGELSALQQRIIARLKERGPQRGRQLDAAFRHVNWRASARGLIHQGLLTSSPVLPKPTVRRKTARKVTLTLPLKELPQALQNTGREGSQACIRRQKSIKLLAGEREPVDVSWVYASSGANAADLRYLEKKGAIQFIYEEVLRDPLDDLSVEVDEAPVLTAGQGQVWDVLAKMMDQRDTDSPALLHGVTGSGKTEIYMRAIDKALRLGKQALVLVPEISLTPQTIRRFTGRFPGKVGVIHSKLSQGERYDTWRRARDEDFSIVIGPRSALFTPFPSIGVIVLDECHDESYYQTDIPPIYHAVEAALAFGRISRAPVILGSATPNVDLYYRAQREKWPILELPKRIYAFRQHTEKKEEERSEKITTADTAASLPLPYVEVVDMREELKAGNRSIFSRKLAEALAHTLSMKQQAILLLNRRGSATYVFCRDCGHSLKCPRCDLPLTYHQIASGLTCHTCGYKRKLPAVCPQCGSARIKQYGTGTEKVEAVLKEQFPGARVLRWDADTTRGKGAEGVILSHFRQHNADILVGTQMLAKGLDLPLVTLVGVVLADVGLNFPDYRTAERTFQLLTQVAGRAGRSALGGSVILQTFNPEHYAIRRAAAHDFKGFYGEELEYRRQLRYPPFVEMVRFEVRSRKREEAQLSAQGLYRRLETLIEKSGNRTLSLVGPVPPYFARQGGYFRWQVILKGSDPRRTLAGEDFRDVLVEVNPPTLL